MSIRYSLALPTQLKRASRILGATVALSLSHQVIAACEYTISDDWGSGFTASITVTNNTLTTVNSWSVDWEYMGDTEITSAWNVALTGTNPYSANNITWNGTLSSGQSTSFGFQGSHSTAEIPDLSGELCDQLPTITPTPEPSAISTPTPTPTPTAVPSAPAPSITPTPTVSPEGISCEVIKTNTWSNGYQLDVEITNSGTAVDSWSVTLVFPEYPDRTGGWNASFTDDGNYIIAEDNGWNGALDTGQTVLFGVQGNHNGTFKEPSCFATGAVVTPIPTPTPVPTEAITPLYSLADFPIGMAVTADKSSRSLFNIPEKQITVAHHFNQVTAGNIMKMSYLHPAEDTYTFDQADKLADWALSNGLELHGHTFIWHSDYQIPNWMRSYSGDFQAMLDEHVQTIAGHFEGKVVSWDVVNEALDHTQSSCYRNSLFYQKLGADYIANAFIAARAADPTAKLYYNDYDTEGGNTTKYECMLQMLDELIAAGVPIDGVGFQMHVQIDWPNTSVMEEAFQAIVDRGLMVKITEIDVPLNNPWASDPFPQYTAFTADAADRQKQRYKSIVAAYKKVVPADKRGGFTVWGLWDGDSWLLNLGSRQGIDDWPLLFTGPANGPYIPKPAFYGVAEALEE